MSKNIVIQEGGVGRQFTADKLTTALVGGGSCNWVPEDEIQLGTKSITENGTYVAANDGEYGYSQVSVNVSSAEKIITGTTDSGEPVVTTIDVVDGTISEIILGDYFIVTYDEDGKVAKIEDNNGNVCTLIYDGETLSGFDDIEDNHYTIILDSNGNISQVIDPNAQDCELRDSDNDGKIDIISIGAVLAVVPDIETGDIKIIDENDNDVTDDYIGTSITGVDSSDTPWRANITDSTSGDGASIGVTPVAPATTPGASIAGIDATTGNEVIATVDDNGNVSVDELPSSIKILFPPTQVDYIDGTPIDYTGLIVKAYKKNGELWTDDDHVAGVIPLNELVLPISNADISKTEETRYKSADGKINAIELMDNIVYDQFNGQGYWRTEQIGTTDWPGSYDNACFMGTDQDLHGGGTFLVTIYNNVIYALARFKTMRVRQVYRQSYQGGFYYYGNFNSGPISPDGFVGQLSGYIDFSEPTIIPESSIDPTGLTLDALINAGGGQKIPVQWARPGDSVVLEESFYINVGTSIYGDNDGN